MADRRPRVLGLTWRKFENEIDENDEFAGNDDSPAKVQNKLKRIRTSASSIGSNAPKKMSKFGRRLSHAVSTTGLGMLETFGSFRQKIRSSTRRRKRLFEVQSPYQAPPPPTLTPSSANRRSARLAAQQQMQMYSPFCIDTPASTKRATPGKIRMGTHEPKRFNFSSPGQLEKDLNTVEESLKQLNKLSEALSAPRTPRNGSGIRTTPGGRRSTSKKRKPIFV